MYLRSLCVALRREALLTKDRFATLFRRTRLKGDLALRTALRTHCIMHLAVLAVTFALVAASLTALWSAQVLCRVELLLTICKDERGVTVSASDILISHEK